MTAYFDEKVYSIELVGAVLRQESFVRNVYGLGGRDPGVSMLVLLMRSF